MRPDFKEKLASFLTGCRCIVTEYRVANGFENNAKWDMTWRKRWVLISGPMFAVFVDIESGEVLKPSGNKPAITKTRRGNIFDEHNGPKHIGPYGVAYANDIKVRPDDEGAAE